jgi:hypothetical protein
MKRDGQDIANARARETHEALAADDGVSYRPNFNARSAIQSRTANIEPRRSRHFIQ